MEASRDALRARLVGAGLERHADALLGLCVPSVRLRAGERRSRPRLPPRHAAVPVPGIVSAVAIGSSWRHRVALPGDGTVRAWGHNGLGQVGDGTKVDRASPVAVRNVEDAIAIAVGETHTLALTAGGAVLAWGANDKGQLGDGAREPRRRPAVVPGLEGGVRAVSAGATSSFAWLEDGTVMAWGGCIFPRSVDPSPHRLRPEPFDALRGTRAIVGNGARHLALAADGAVLTWGVLAGQDSAGNPEYRVSELPAPVDGLPPVVALAAGEYHHLALDACGAVHAWGANSFGACGHADHDLTFRGPAPIDGLPPVRALAAAGSTSLALTAAGRVVAWGYSGQGALGDPEVRFGRHTAGQVAGLVDEQLVAVAAGLVLRADGAVLEWGEQMPRDAPAWDDGLPIGCSKLGGRPDLPRGVRWPRCDGRPMTFLAQVALADIAAHDATARLPSTGMLVAFADLEDPEMAAGRLLLVASDELARPKPPRGAPELNGAVALLPEPELTLPPDDSDVVLGLGLSADERSSYTDLIWNEDDARHRVLGHPDPEQDDPRTGRHELLLQLDLAEETVFEAGEGRMYWLVSGEDLAAGRLDGALLIFQQT